MKEAKGNKMRFEVGKRAIKFEKIHFKFGNKLLEECFKEIQRFHKIKMNKI